MSTKAIGYIRVSTEKQADLGMSLEVQEKQVRGYAGIYDLEVVALEKDAGASAKTLDRPGFKRALARLVRGDGTALIVAKLDRLTRSVKDLGWLIEKYFSGDRYSLLSVSEQIDTRSAGGKLMLNVLMSVSQWEREVIGERTSGAMQLKIERGEWTGGTVPFGYRRAGKILVENVEEQRVIERIRWMRERKYSLRAVAEELTRLGARPRRGRWSPMQVKRLLEKERP